MLTQLNLGSKLSAANQSTHNFRGNCDRSVNMAPQKFDQRFQIELMLKEGASQREIKQRLDALHGGLALSKSSVQRWCSQFRNGRVQENLPKSGAPKKRTAAKIAQVRAKIQVDRRSTIRQLAQDVNLSFGCTRRLLTEDLKVRKTPAKWVPHLLTDPERQCRVDLARRSLQMLCRCANPIDVVITQDESWVYCWDPQPKASRREWLRKNQTCPEKVPIEHSVQKLMLVVFIDKDGLIFREFVPNGLGIGGRLYRQILERFLQALRRRHPHLATRAGKLSWVLLHDGAPAHRSAPVVNYLRAESVQVLPHPGYSPDLNPMDYWFFYRIKSKVKGIRHHDLNQLQQSVDATIASITQQEFANAMARLPERLRRCVAAQGRYFERE